jgi:hypothetical protein
MATHAQRRRRVGITTGQRPVQARKRVGPHEDNPWVAVHGDACIVRAYEGEDSLWLVTDRSSGLGDDTVYAFVRRDRHMEYGLVTEEDLEAMHEKDWIVPLYGGVLPCTLRELFELTDVAFHFK